MKQDNIISLFNKTFLIFSSIVIIDSRWSELILWFDTMVWGVEDGDIPSFLWHFQYLVNPKIS